MILKTNDLTYQMRFQSKIDETKGYEENNLNNDKLISLYNRIIGAQEQTKQTKIQNIKQLIEKQKQKLTYIESISEKQNPDHYLAEAIAKL